MALNPSRDLLEHSFYRRWLEGTLTLDELRDYAGQYAHVVKALPRWLRSAAKHANGEAGELLHHADEEAGHLELWQRFASALGLSAEQVDAAQPNPATRSLLDAAGELSGEPAGIAVAWAVESQAAAVSREKLTGLAAQYGIAGAGAEYFRLHAVLDLAHTAQLDRRIGALDAADLAAAQTISDTVQEGLWNLLTSVERAA